MTSSLIPIVEPPVEPPIEPPVKPPIKPPVEPSVDPPAEIPEETVDLPKTYRPEFGSYLANNAAVNTLFFHSL